MALEADVIQALLLYLLPAAFSVFVGLAGLWINLLHPKLDWKNETEVVKQGFPTFVTVFGSMLLVGIPLALLLLGIMDAPILGYAFTALCALGAFLIWKWLCSKGVRRFAEL